MNGAVHGDAMTTASTPEPNASTVRFFAVKFATPDGASWPNSKTPDRLSASTKKSIASTVTTAGDCSWKPQPSCSPAARSAASRSPSATNVMTTPARERERLAAQRRLAVVVRGEAQHLERQHGEHARHQVEDDAAQEGERNRDGERQPGVRRHGCRRARGCSAGGAARASSRAWTPRSRSRRAPTSIVAARTPPPKPPAAVSTPATRPNSPLKLNDTGSVSTYAPPSRRRFCGTDGSIFASAYGKNCSVAGIGSAGRRLELHLDGLAASLRARPASPRADAAALRASRRSAPQRASGRDASPPAATA